MLIELGVVEQRHRAVLEVQGGLPVTEVALRYGVTRQTVHRWLRRYEAAASPASPTRSSRPASCPHRMAPQVEARIVALRARAPRLGAAHPPPPPRARGRSRPLPSRSSVYRCLVRSASIEPQKRRRKREDYRRWERLRPMELWQMDVMGGVQARGRRRAQGRHRDRRPLALLRLRAPDPAGHGAPGLRGLPRGDAPPRRPEQVLTDNGKVFTARFGLGAGEVLFDRICREHGVRHLLTAPRSPTTTGKVERFHKTVRSEFLTGRVFASLEEAQAALDAWVGTLQRRAPPPGHRHGGCPARALRARAPQEARPPPVLRRAGRTGPRAARARAGSAAKDASTSRTSATRSAPGSPARPSS